LATWKELSREHLRTAKLLIAEGHPRGSVNRSYYAAYCALTDALRAKGLTFPYGWGNPPHDQLPELIANNLALPREVRWQLRKVIRALRKAREDADYRPGVDVNRVLALNCIRDAITVLRKLGIEDDATG
jgi:uncharacterized protein (UPF0332 family)